MKRYRYASIYQSSGAVWYIYLSDHERKPTTVKHARAIPAYSEQEAKDLAEQNCYGLIWILSGIPRDPRWALLPLGNSLTVRLREIKFGTTFDREDLSPEEIEDAAAFFDRLMEEREDFYKGKKLMPGQED